jgi:prophage regulatory protein
MPPPNETITLRVVRLATACHRTGLTAPTLYRLMQLKMFPQSILLGGNSRGWLDHEITAWLQERITARDSGTDADRRTNPNIGRGRPKQPGAGPKEGAEEDEKSAA